MHGLMNRRWSTHAHTHTHTSLSIWPEGQDHKLQQVQALLEATAVELMSDGASHRYRHSSSSKLNQNQEAKQ